MNQQWVNYSSAKVASVLFLCLLFTALSIQPVSARLRQQDQTSAATTDTPITDAAALYLPIIMGPEPQWHLLGGSGQSFRTLALGTANAQGEPRLYTANRTDSATGGLYRLTHCQNSDGANPLTPLLSAPYTYDVALQDNAGVAVTFTGQVYTSNDYGTTWTLTNNSLPTGVYAVTFGKDNLVYAATDQGLYQSSNYGVIWRLVPGSDQLKPLNTLWYDQETGHLWIGAAHSGVWRFNGSAFESLTLNLPDDGRSRDVWSIVKMASNPAALLIGTSNGVYRRNGEANWEWVGPTDNNALNQMRVYTLAAVGEVLYAGVRERGVWQINLNQTAGNWQQVQANLSDFSRYTVRRLLYVEPLCNGLLAATDNGVWVLR